jgi:hypothetical protein
MGNFNTVFRKLASCLSWPRLNDTTIGQHRQVSPYRDSPEDTLRYNSKPLSGYRVFGLKFGPGTFRKRNRNASHPTSAIRWNTVKLFTS